METKDVSNAVVTILLVAAIVLLVALAQGTPAHPRSQVTAPAASAAASTTFRA